MRTHQPFRFGLILAAALAVAVPTVSAEAASKVARADLIASNCFNCHGFEGESIGVIDGLHDMSAKALVKKMNEFRSGAKPSTIMKRIAKGYTADEIQAMGRYFESLDNK